MAQTTQTSIIRCPACNTKTKVQMPTERCQFFWDCPACGAVVRPEAGDCCVFCSYGSVPCPPVQQAASESNASTGNAPNKNL